MRPLSGPKFAAICAAVLLSPQHAGASEVLVVDVARLFDGREVIDNARLVIEGGKILAAGPRDRVPVPDGSRLANLDARTIIPGLISAHAHVGMVDGVNLGGHNYTAEILEHDLRRYQRYGVVAVNSLGLNRPLFHALRDRMRNGEHGGADLYGAGSGIGSAGGAPPAANRLPDQVVRPASPEEARVAVAAMSEAGIDMVKIWVDDMGGKAPKLPPETYRAAIEEADRNGLKAAVHIHDLSDAKAVLRAGADVIAHGVRDQAVDQEFIDLMLAAEAWYIPTITVVESDYLFAEHPEWLDDPYLRLALDPRLEAQLRDPEWRAKALADAASSRARVDHNIENLRALHRAGVKIGFGTDAGAAPLRLPGFAEHRELGHFVAAEMSPIAALRAATSDSAALIGAKDRGCLWSGCRADLLVLTGDPTRDIAQIRSIVQVWRNGKAVDAVPPTR